VTAYEFKAAWPEFTNTDSALVSARIAVAESLCPEAVWTDETRRNHAIGLTVAHALALSPAARDMQLVADGTTVYEKELADLRAITAGGPRTIL
jgi:hypothetical protein